MMQDYLIRVLNIRPGEGKPVLWLLLHSFFVGIVILFLNTASRTLFLTKFDVDIIRYAYIGVAIVVSLLGYIYTRIQKKVTFEKSLLINLLFLFASIALIRISLSVTDSTWPAMVLFIWTEVTVVFLGLELWGLTGRIIDVRQGKRLFGLIGTGEMMAGVAGGLTVSAFVGLIGTSNLLIIALLGLSLCIISFLHITRRYSSEIGTVEEEEEPVEKMSLKQMFAHRYLSLIFVACVLSVFTYYFIDYAFYEQVEIQFPDENKLAMFFGVFFALLNVVSLFFRFFISGRLLSRYGLNAGMVALPSMLLVGAVAMMITGNISGLVLTFFGITVITKLLDEAVRTSVEEPSYLILYQPLPAESRMIAETTVDSLVGPLAGGLAGVLLLLLGLLFDLEAVHMAYLAAPVLVVWILTAFVLKTEYGQALVNALSKRRFSGVELPFDDGSSMSVLNKFLRSPNADEVIYSLNILEKLNHNLSGEVLIDLLSHEGARVREEALHRIERSREVEAIGALRERSKVETNPRVMGLMLRTLSSLGGEDACDLVRAYLGHPEPSVRQGALVGLLRMGGGGTVREAVDMVGRMAVSGNPDDRTLAAQILGEVGKAEFRKYMVLLMEDKNEDVRRAALCAAGQCEDPSLWPLVAENLLNISVASTAASSLERIGEAVVPHLENLFDRASIPRIVKLRIVRICRRIPGDSVVAMLKKMLDSPDGLVRKYALSAMLAKNYTASEEEMLGIKKLIKGELDLAGWFLISLEDLQKDHEESYLMNALEYELGQIIERILYLLAFLYDPDSVMRAKMNFETGAKDKKALALETIDQMTPQDIKDPLIALMDDIPTFQKVRRLAKYFPHESLPLDQRLRELIGEYKRRASAWTCACAILMAGERVRGGLKREVEGLCDRSDVDPLVHETAKWTASVLNKA